MSALDDLIAVLVSTASESDESDQRIVDFRQMIESLKRENNTLKAEIRNITRANAWTLIYKDADIVTLRDQIQDITAEQNALFDQARVDRDKIASLEMDNTYLCGQVHDLTSDIAWHRVSNSDKI